MLRRRLLAAWVVFIAARSISVLLGAPHPWVWTALFSADALLLGTFLGATGVRWNDRRALQPVFVAGTALLFVGGVLPDIRLPGLHQVVVYSLVAVGAAVWTLTALDTKWLQWLGVRPLRYLGKISYGLYVVHLVGISVGSKIALRISGGWWIQFSFGLTATILIAVVSYELFERRFLVLKKRFETVATRRD